MSLEDENLEDFPDRGESTVLRGDARRLKELLSSELGAESDSGFVNATVNSPPYANIKDYGEEDQIGSGQAYEAYIDSLRMVYSGVYDVTTEDGSLWVVINNRRGGNGVESLQQDVANALVDLEEFTYCPLCGEEVETTDDGETLFCENTDNGAHDEPWCYEKQGRSWTFENEIIWDKGKSNDERGGFRNVSEYVLVFSKSDEFEVEETARIYDPKVLEKWWVSDTYNYSAEGAKYPNVWQIPAPVTGGWVKGNKPKHSAIYPPKLVERIIECSTSAGDVVFDPFTGTGTTLFVGEAMERRSVGIELNQEYINSHDDRRENIEAKLGRVRERYVQKENRKRQFEQATWDLIHHGYPKFLMSGLRTELNHLNFPSKLWDEIESSVSWGSGSNLSKLEIGDGTEPVKEALESETPISTFLRGIRESLQLPPEAEEPLDDRSRERLQRQYVDNLLEVWDPTTLIEELLSAHSDDTAPQTLTSGPGDSVVELYWQGAYKDCAKRVLQSAEDSAAEVVRNLSISVGSGDIHGYLQPSKANLDAEFKGDNPGDGFDSSIFGVGILMAGVGSLDASGRTDVSVFEPVLPAYEAYGKRCGVATIIVDPDTKYGVPENEGENPGVTYHLLLRDGEREVDLDNFEAAFARLREYPSGHSYNTQKIQKHSLYVTIDCRSAVDAHQVLSDVKGWGEEFYLYNDDYSQVTQVVNKSDEMIDSLVDAPGQWEDHWAQLSWPPLFSPFKIDIRKVTGSQEEHYSIFAINEFGHEDLENQEGAQATLTSYE